VATEEPSEDATTEGQRTLYGFRAVYVFDRSQTEGKDLPALTEVQGDVSGYRERLVRFVEAHGITLNYSDKIGPAKGLAEHAGVAILTKLSAPEFRADSVVVRPLSDPSLCFDTCLVMRSDDDSKLTNQFARSFLRRFPHRVRASSQTESR
jgi:hypothetical protein